MNAIDWTSVGFVWFLLPVILISCDAVPGLRAARSDRSWVHVPKHARQNAARSHGHTPVDDFTILVPIYGALSYLENVSYLSAYGERVLLCTTISETEDFYRDLDEIARRHDFQVFVGHVARGTRRGQRSTGGTVRDRLVRDALPHVSTEYVVCIDADTTTLRPLDDLVGEMQGRELDLASVRLVPANSNASFLSRIQAHEFRFAMQLRTLMPWLVSGACHAARTSVHRELMSRHSLFFQGNDVEVGLLADALGYRVGHVRFEVLTVVPASLKPWLRQRLAWAGGEVRLFVANPHIAFRHPYFWVYGAILAIAASPLRWGAIVHPGVPLAIILVAYFTMIVYLHFGQRDRYLLLLPFYTMFSSLVLTPLGLIWYAKMALADRNLGFIRLGRGSDMRQGWRNLDLARL